MSDQTLFTILHISDFHFSKRKQREQGLIVDALEKDLKTLCIGHRKPDLIVFTGDLVQAAGTDLHDDAYDFLIDRVSKATRCSDERIFVVPGNHDLSLAGLEKYKAETREWRSIIGSNEETQRFNELYESKSFEASINEKFSNYFELERYISDGSRSENRRISNPFVTVDYIEAINADIVIFNSAAFSTGGSKDYEKDHRNLVIPEYAILEAVKLLTPGSFRIFATHHPWASLSEQSAKIAESEVTKHADIHLFGHMHDPQPKQIVGLNGELLSDQAGALFTARREYYNGYSLITIDRSDKHVETMVRSYFKERNEFDDGIDVVEGGRWWSSNEAKQHFRKIASPVDDEKFRAHLAGPALSALLAREASAGAEGQIHDRFVEPPLKRTFIQEVTGDESRGESELSVEFDEILGGDANLILYAKPEYGRTTLIRELRYRQLYSALEVKFPRIPVIIDFSEISSNSDNMLRKLKGLSEATPDDNDLESLLKLGHVCVMVDDVIFSDLRKIRILRDFISRFPKVRYILSGVHSSVTVFGANIDPETAVRFEFVEIREFRRNDMRQLLAKDQRCTDVEEWLDRLQTEFREINLPFTAANGSILIEILSEKYNFTPINRAVLMEQFVDSTLRKAAIEQSRRETFDYTNKTDLLSHIAAWMAKTEVYLPSKESVRDEMKSYVDRRGLNVELDDLLSEFLNARIFINRSEGRISFRYRGVLEYFIALRMTADDQFRSWVLDEDRYLRFVSEILYYAGKLRNDSKLVDLVADRHGRLVANAIEFKDSDIATLDVMAIPNENEAVGAIGEDLSRNPLSKEEKDRERENEFPKDEEDRQEVFRPDISEIGDKASLSLLLYSGLIKNMELISDEEKRKHISEILRGWSLFLLEALRLAPRLARDRRLRINGARYEVQAPYGMDSAKLLQRLMLLLPHIHVKLLSSALGTEKLERQLTEPSLIEGDEPKIYDFFRAGLITDLKFDAAPNAIKNLSSKLRDNRYLLWSLIVHISELRRLGRVKESHYLLMEEPLAGAIANLRGGSHKSKESTKRKQMARLAQERLILTMKRDRERH